MGTHPHRGTRQRIRRVLAMTLTITVAGAALAVALAACDSGSSGPQAQGTPGAPQNCGTVLISGGRQAPTNGPVAQQAETCFSRAYAKCQAAALTLTIMGVDSGVIRTFTLQRNSGGACQVMDARHTYIAPSHDSPTATFTCAGLQAAQGAQGGLVVVGCGADGDIAIPASPRTVP